MRNTYCGYDELAGFITNVTIGSTDYNYFVGAASHDEIVVLLRCHCHFPHRSDLNRQYHHPPPLHQNVHSRPFLLPPRRSHYPILHNFPHHLEAIVSQSLRRVIFGSTG